MTDPANLWISDSLMLFQEDLSAILDILKTTQNMPVVIGDNECTYSSFDELRKIKGDDVSEFYLANTKIGISLKLTKSERKGTLIATQVSDETELTFLRTKDFLEKMKRPMAFWVSCGPKLRVRGSCWRSWLVFPNKPNLHTANAVTKSRPQD